MLKRWKIYGIQAHPGYDNFALNILITGGSGYIATALIREVEKSGHQLLVSSRNLAKLKKSNMHTRFTTLSYENSINLENQLRGIDVVIHAAGLDSKSCELNPQQALEVNGNYSKKLIQASSHVGVKRFIYISTAHVYKQPLVGHIDEATKLENRHPYATSHSFAELALMDYQDHFSFGGLVIRLANTFGLPIGRKSLAWDLILNNLCKQVITKKGIYINSNPNIQRNFISLQLACKIITDLSLDLTKDGYSGILNLGGSKSYSIGEAAQLVRDVALENLGIKCPIQYSSSNSILGSDFNLDFNSLFLNLPVIDMNGNILELLMEAKKYFNNTELIK